MTGKCIRQHSKLPKQGLADYADIWAELAAWDEASDEALRNFEEVAEVLEKQNYWLNMTGVATPRQPTFRLTICEN